MPTDRFTNITLGTNLTGTDNADGSITIDAAGGSGIPATLLDAKGDLIVATAADTAARLAIGGTNGHVLTVDSAEATGVKWAAGAGGWSASPAYVKAYRSSTQSIPAAWTTLLWNAEAFDSGGMHDNSTDSHRLTVPTGQGGTYAVLLAAYLTGGSGGDTGIRGIQILKNSTTVNTGLIGQASWTVAVGISNAIPAMAVVDLAAGDWVACVAYAATGTVNLLVDSSFQMWRIA